MGASSVAGENVGLPDRECIRERDEIYSLLAYAIVFKDWQAPEDYGTPVERGHNIGSVSLTLPVKQFSGHAIATQSLTTLHSMARSD